jgi:ubiquinone biosynthesis protein COQ4
MIRYLKAIRLLREFRQAEAQDKPLEKLFEAERIFNEPVLQKSFDRFKKSAVADKVFAADKELINIQSDREYLMSLPEGSLGREFLSFMDENLDFYAGYQYDMYKNAWADALEDEEKKRFMSRLFACHDFVHLTVGWSRMILGEAHAAAFHSTPHQNDSNSFKFLVTVGHIKVLATAKDLKTLWMFIKSIREAKRLSKKIPFIATIDWESMMAMPLEEVKKKIGVSEDDIKNYRALQLRYSSVHSDLFKAEYNELAKKQYEICSGPNAQEIKSVVATTI